MARLIAPPPASVGAGVKRGSIGGECETWNRLDLELGHGPLDNYLVNVKFVRRIEVIQLHNVGRTFCRKKIARQKDRVIRKVEFDHVTVEIRNREHVPTSQPTSGIGVSAT